MGEKIKEKKAVKKPSIVQAYGTIVFMLIVIGLGNGKFGLDLKMMLIVCTAFNMIMAAVLHHSWQDIQDGIVNKITSMGGCFLILLGIGFLAIHHFPILIFLLVDKDVIIVPLNRTPRNIGVPDDEGITLGGCQLPKILLHGIFGEAVANGQYFYLSGLCTQGDGQQQ